MSHRLLLFLMLCFFAYTAKAQTLHAIICADDGSTDRLPQGGDRRKDRAEDLNNLKDFMANIAYHTGLKLNQKVYTGSDFNLTNLDAGLRNLRVGSEDVIFFYFNGHGANEQKDGYPSLKFYDRFYRLLLIHNYLCKSNAKLVISVGDCCNNYMYGRNLAQNKNDIVQNGNMVQNYKALFRNFSGRKGILIAAASPGEMSISDLRYGAIFGIFLRASFYRTVENSAEPTWENILRNAKNDTYQYTKNAADNDPTGKSKPHTPIYDIRPLSSLSTGSTDKPVSKQVRLFVIDELGTNQIAETMQIDICGVKTVLNLDLNNRSKYATFTFNKQGVCNYKLGSMTTFVYRDEYGRQGSYNISGYGEGRVEISPNKQYIIYSEPAPNSNSLRLYFKEKEN